MTVPYPSNLSGLVDAVRVPAVLLEAPPHETVRAAARVLALLLGALGSGVLLYAALGLGRLTLQRGAAWRVALQRAGWWPAAASAAILLVLFALLPLFGLSWELTHLTQAVIPAMFALQAGLLLAPEDEPGLELVLTCPRPYPWLGVERLVVVLGGQVMVGVAASAAAQGLGEGRMIAGSVTWLPPALLLGGLAGFVATRSRQSAVGVVVALLAWFAFGAGTKWLLPAHLSGQAWSGPLSVLQPWLWTAHAYLQPGSMAAADYALNRVIVAGLGLGLLAEAVLLLADAERALLGAPARVRKDVRKEKRST